MAATSPMVEFQWVQTSRWGIGQGGGGTAMGVAVTTQPSPPVSLLSRKKRRSTTVTMAVTSPALLLSGELGRWHRTRATVPVVVHRRAPGDVHETHQCHPFFYCSRPQSGGHHHRQGGALDRGWRCPPKHLH
jgi:hypothetical protein